MCAWGLRGTVPALAGNVGTGGAFALPREGNYRESTFLRSLWPGPAPLDVFGGGLRGFGPALAGNVGRGRAFALNARGELGCGRSNARCEPNPLRLCHGVGLGVVLGSSWGRSQICGTCGTDPSDTTPPTWGDPADSNVIRWVTFVGEGLGAPRVRFCARREA